MLGGPRERSSFPPPSGGFTPPRCGLFLLRRSQPPGRPITIGIPAVLTRAGLSMRVVVPGARPDAHANPRLIRLLLQAFAIQDRLAHTPDLTLQQLAEAGSRPR